MEWLPFNIETLSATLMSAVGDSRKFGAGPWIEVGEAVGKPATPPKVIVGSPLGNCAGAPSGGITLNPYVDVKYAVPSCGVCCLCQSALALTSLTKAGFTTNVHPSWM